MVPFRFASSSLPPRAMTDQILRLDPQHHLLDLMKSALSRINGPGIDVRILGEELLLTGTVNSWHEKQHAQECIRELSRGRPILNDIRVDS